MGNARIAMKNIQINRGLSPIISQLFMAANNGEIAIQGAEVSIRSGLNRSNADLKDTTKKTGIDIRDLTGSFKPGEGVGFKSALTTETARTTLAHATLDAQNIALQSTAGDLTLAAVEITARGQTTENGVQPGTLTLDAARDLNLASLATSDYQSLDLKKKDLAWQSVKGSGTQDETTRYTRLNAGQIQISAGNRITADMSVKDSAQILANEPGMDWLKQIQEDPRLSTQIDWNQIEEAHRKWDYDQQGLTPAAAVVVAIVVAYFTAGAGAEAVAGMTGTTATTTATAAQVAAAQYATATVMTQAAITTLASQASVSLINNQEDICATLHELGSQDNLRQLAIAMVTAGALRGGSASLDSIFHFLSGSLAVKAYAAFGSAGRLSK